MTRQEYFGGWMNVLPFKEMQEAITKVSPIREKICPNYKNMFKAFNKCPYEKLKLVIVAQDPYPQKDIATGLAFANFNYVTEEKLSPSLQVIKESVINYEVSHNLITFANDLEEWARQGVLLLNTALTCEINKPGSHSLIWRPFTSKLIKNICENNTGIVFLLLGQSAQSFKPYINKNQYIIEAKHPSYYARTNEKLPYHIWKDINKIVIGVHSCCINFYHEQNYEDSVFRPEEW